MNHTSNDDTLHLAELAYTAYGDNRDWKNHQGNSMPDFDDLGDAIQAAWISAATAIREHLTTT